jgi:hypothetical protein
MFAQWCGDVLLKVLFSFHVLLSGTGRGFEIAPLRKHKRCALLPRTVKTKRKMNLTKKLIELLTISMLTMGCATIKHESFRTVDKLEKTDFNKLNGRYSNNPSNGIGKILRSQYNGESLVSIKNI